MSKLTHKRYWLFDMDGTLTHAIHDFDAIRAELGLPQGAPIIEAIDRHDATTARRLHAQLDALELDIALQASAQAGAQELLTTENIVSRHCCAPKPDPAGVQMLLKRWSAKAEDSVMVGDFLYDLSAGRAAGVSTVHLDVTGNFPWPDATDIGVVSLRDLLDLVIQGQ